MPLIILAGAATIVVLHEAGPVLVPLLVSLLLAYALEPFVAGLVRCGLPRLGAAIIVYLVLAIGAAVLAHTTRRHIDTFLDDLPETVAALERTVTTMANDAADDGSANPLERLQHAIRTVQQAAAPPAPAPGVQRVVEVRRGFDVRDYLVDAGLTVADTGAQFVAIALLTFFLIASGDFSRRKVLALTGPRFADRAITIEALERIDKQIERYLVVRVLISVIVATTTGLSLWLLGVSHATVWGGVAGVLNVLPFIGPSTAVTLIAIAAFLQFRTLEMAGAAGGVSALIAAFEGSAITPWLTSRAGELNVVAVFVSVLFWGWLWDVWGLVLAVPIVVAIKAAADHIEPLHPIGELLGR